MKVTYDKSSDAAYIYLVDSIGPGGVKRAHPLEPVEELGQINLDFDAEGILIGIEVLDASKKLPDELLRSAESIG